MSRLLRAFFLLSVLAACNCEFQFFSRQARALNPDEIIDDVKLVVDAMKCIRRESCALPKKYSKLLKEAGPMLLVYGYCPPNMCTYEEEQKAKDLLHRISLRYPKLFYHTYKIVRKWFEA